MTAGGSAVDRSRVTSVTPGPVWHDRPVRRLWGDEEAVDARTTLWRLPADGTPLLAGTLLSTPRLTVTCAELLPSRDAAARCHAGDLGLYVLVGELDVRLPADGEASALTAGDGFYVPGGTPYAFANASSAPCSFIFAVAPTGPDRP